MSSRRGQQGLARAPLLPLAWLRAALGPASETAAGLEGWGACGARGARHRPSASPRGAAVAAPAKVPLFALMGDFICFSSRLVGR